MVVCLQILPPSISFLLMLTCHAYVKWLSPIPFFLNQARFYCPTNKILSKLYLGTTKAKFLPETLEMLILGSFPLGTQLLKRSPFVGALTLCKQSTDNITHQSCRRAILDTYLSQGLNDCSSTM